MKQLSSRGFDYSLLLILGAFFFFTVLSEVTLQTEQKIIALFVSPVREQRNKESNMAVNMAQLFLGRCFVLLTSTRRVKLLSDLKTHIQDIQTIKPPLSCRLVRVFVFSVNLYCY